MNTDGYVYGLGIGTAWSWYGGVFLTRVPKNDILNYAAYEYYTGMDDAAPRWDVEPYDAVALPGVHTAAKGSAMYHPGMDRCLFFTAKALYDAPAPWGPWTFAGAWGGTLAPEEWRGGYMPGMISKDTGPNDFWFTLSGQNFPPLITYRLQLGRMVMVPREATGIPNPGEVTNVISTNYVLGQNHPNPFNPSTEISFQIQRTGMVSLEVFNLLGEKVATLVRQHLTAGMYKVTLDGTGLNSGVYFFLLQAGDFAQTKKCLLIK